MDSPKVIVLILSYNGKKLLEDALTSYLDNDYSNFKIVVIDNGSTDKTDRYVELNFPVVDLFRIKKNRGYSGGFNAGIGYAMKTYSPDYLLISNNDVFVDKGVIKSLVKSAEENPFPGFVTGKTYYHDYHGNRNIIQTVGKKFDAKSFTYTHIGSGEKDIGQYDRQLILDACDDVFILVSKNVVNKTQGYDENFFHENEELDWQLRSKKLGFKIYFSPEAKVWHKVSATTGGWKNPLINYFSFRNQILIVKRHSDKNTFARFMIKRLFFFLPINILLNLLRSEFDIPMQSIKGTLSGLIWLVKEDFGVKQ